MKKSMFIIAISLALLILLSGCIETMFVNTDELIGTWESTDGTSTVRFDKDGTGVSQGDNDYFFTYSLHPSKDHKMIWILDSDTTLIVDYTLIFEDTKLVMNDLVYVRG